MSVIATGIHQPGRGLSTFVLMPNPNAGSFTIKGALSATADGQLDITVTDVLGQTVYSKKAEASNGNLDEKIDLPKTIARGMYLVSITSGTEHVVFHVSIEK